jgi:hypothetical protein
MPYGGMLPYRDPSIPPYLATEDPTVAMLRTLGRGNSPYSSYPGVATGYPTMPGAPPMQPAPLPQPLYSRDSGGSGLSIPGMGGGNPMSMTNSGTGSSPYGWLTGNAGMINRMTGRGAYNFSPGPWQNADPTAGFGAMDMGGIGASPIGAAPTDFGFGWSGNPAIASDLGFGASPFAASGGAFGSSAGSGLGVGAGSFGGASGVGGAGFGIGEGAIGAEAAGAGAKGAGSAGGLGAGGGAAGAGGMGAGGAASFLGPAGIGIGAGLLASEAGANEYWSSAIGAGAAIAALMFF